MIPNIQRWPRRNLRCQDCDMITAHLKRPLFQDLWICARCGRTRFGDETKEQEARQRTHKYTAEDICK